MASTRVFGIWVGLAVAALWVAVCATGQDRAAKGQDGKGPARAGKAAEPVLHLGTVERVTVYPKSRRIEMSGEVQLHRSQAVELVACARGGKTHESIFLLKCRPSDLNAALLLIGCKFKSGPRRFQDPVKPVGTRVVIEMEWTPAKPVNAKKIRKRVEDLCWDQRYGTAMPRIAWVYVGSKFGRDPVTKDEVFVADRERNLITTLHDPFGLLDNPLPSGGDVTPGRYVANPKQMPPQGTAIRVYIRRATDKEIAASKRAEQAAAKADAKWRAERAAKAKAAAERHAKEKQEGGGK